MQTIERLLKKKNGEQIMSISPRETVYNGLKLMAEKNVSALMVIDNCEVTGIFTERDYCRKVILKGLQSHDIHVDELMTSRIIYATQGDTLDVCMALMTSNNIRHLPIFDRDELVGIVTLSDVVKQMLSDQKIKINNFENLVNGGYGTCK